MVYVFGHGHDLDVLMLCSFLFPIFDFQLLFVIVFLYEFLFLVSYSPTI